MEKGFLSQYFEKVALKRLSKVECDTESSNQHEINGGVALQNIFGTIKDKLNIQTNFIYLSSDEGGYESIIGDMTWYDARAKHPTRTEYRLYYQGNSITNSMSEGDLLIIGKQTNGDTLFLVVEKGSSIENQVLWLLNSEKISEEFHIKDINKKDKKLDFASRFILEELGIQIKNTNEEYLEIMLNNFGNSFPTTKVFSEFARNTLPKITGLENPDLVILEWMNQEEILFRTFERHIINERLKSEKNTMFDNGGIANVDFFIQFSLSIQNTRKSRVGQSLENHLEQIFKLNRVKFSRGQNTENRSKPDFLFPGIDYYHGKDIDKGFLTMLGAKTTCKDRWRQVLTEAEKIKSKHLFTLEPSISENQTNEMQKHNLQLVIPQELFQTYKNKQQDWLMNLNDFLRLINERENKIII